MGEPKHDQLRFPIDATYVSKFLHGNFATRGSRVRQELTQLNGPAGSH